MDVHLGRAGPDSACRHTNQFANVFDVVKQARYVMLTLADVRLSLENWRADRRSETRLKTCALHTALPSRPSARYRRRLFCKRLGPPTGHRRRDTPLAEAQRARREGAACTTKKKRQ